MIPIPSGVKVWIATGITDMRRGMNGLSLQVQEALGRDPHAGDLYVFRGRRGDLIKVLWHDGLGLSLYGKRLERGRFVGRRWPTASFRSLQRSSATCWRRSIGGIRKERGDRVRQGDSSPTSFATERAESALLRSCPSRHSRMTSKGWWCRER